MQAQAYLVKDALISFFLPEANRQCIKSVTIANLENHYSLMPFDNGKGYDLLLASKLQKIFSDETEAFRTNLWLYLKSRSTCLGSSSYSPHLDYLEVQLCSAIFKNLIVSLGEQMQLRLELKNSEVEVASANPQSPLCTARLPWNPQNGYTSFSGTTDKFPQRWAQFWNTSLNMKYSVQVSIIVCGSVVLQAPYNLDAMAKETYCVDNDKEGISRKLLEDDIATDTTIISSDGSRIEYHNSFLIAQSPVFQAMLTGGRFKEEESQEIEMVDITENGVNAILAFLYYRGLEEQDLKLAVELLQAGNKYDISSLENVVTALILQKPIEWFDISTTIQLFFFSKNIGPLAGAMVKCLQTLKIKSAELTASDDFKQLFEDANDSNRVAAWELSTALINL